MSITKLSPNWACQMGPIHCPKFLLPGLSLCERDISGCHDYYYCCHDNIMTTRFPPIVCVSSLVTPRSSLQSRRALRSSSQTEFFVFIRSLRKFVNRALVTI